MVRCFIILTFRICNHMFYHVDLFTLSFPFHRNFHILLELNKNDMCFKLNDMLCYLLQG